MIVGGHGGNIRAASELYGYNPEEFIDFSANINPLGAPKQLNDILASAAKEIQNYPDIEYVNLKTALSEYYNLSVQNIIAGNGSAELIDLFIRVAGKSDVIIIEPNFYEYERGLKNNGIIPEYLIGDKKENFKVGIEKIIPALKENSILFISSPNNPVGYTYSKEEIQQLLKEIKKKNSLLFIDEAFIDFKINEKDLTAIDLIENNPELVVLKSLTKILAVPGLRLGMLLASKEIISNMNLLKTPWSINCFASALGENIKEFETFISQSAKNIFTERKKMEESLSRILNLQIYKGEVNYFLCKLDEKYSFEKFEMYLGENKILIRSCSNYPGLTKQFFRVAVKTKYENNFLIQKINDFFDNEF